MVSIQSIRDNVKRHTVHPIGIKAVRQSATLLSCLRNHGQGDALVAAQDDDLDLGTDFDGVERIRVVIDIYDLPAA